MKLHDLDRRLLHDRSRYRTDEVVERKVDHGPLVSVLQEINKEAKGEKRKKKKKSGPADRNLNNGMGEQ